MGTDRLTLARLVIARQSRRIPNGRENCRLRVSEPRDWQTLSSWARDGVANGITWWPRSLPRSGRVRASAAACIISTAAEGNHPLLLDTPAVGSANGHPAVWSRGGLAEGPKLRAWGESCPSSPDSCFARGQLAEPAIQSCLAGRIHVYSLALFGRPVHRLHRKSKS